VKKTEIPSQEEIQILLDAADPLTRAAITFMAYLGLRVGRLPDFSITRNRWLTFTKGKKQSGEISDEIRAVITRGGLSLKGPFLPLTAQNLKDRFGYMVGKLVTARKISKQYSCYDLRHAFAVHLNEANGRDIYRPSKARGHANIGVTETYLKTLKKVL
jgi:integrase